MGRLVSERGAENVVFVLLLLVFDKIKIPELKNFN